MFENWAEIIDGLMEVSRVTVLATILFLAVYALLRRPGWPVNPGQIKVPHAGWIVAAIIAFVVIMFAYLISRDPLAPRS